MSVHILTHPELPGRELTVSVAEGSRLSPQYARSGWTEQTTAPTVVKAPEQSNPETTKTSAEPAESEQETVPLNLTKEK